MAGAPGFGASARSHPRKGEQASKTPGPLLEKIKAEVPHTRRSRKPRNPHSVSPTAGDNEKCLFSELLTEVYDPRPHPRLEKGSLHPGEPGRKRLQSESPRGSPPFHWLQLEQITEYKEHTGTCLLDQRHVGNPSHLCAFPSLTVHFESWICTRGMLLPAPYPAASVFRWPTRVKLNLFGFHMNVR